MRYWTFGGDPVGDYRKVQVTQSSSAADIARALSVEPTHLLLTAVFATDARGPALASGVNPAWIFVVVRGDQVIDWAGLIAAARDSFGVGITIADHMPWSSPRREIGRAASAESAATVGSPGDHGHDALRVSSWPEGYVGPDAAMKENDAVLLVDPDAAQPGFWAAGANEAGWYALNFNWFRECGDRLADLRKTVVAEIARR